MNIWRSNISASASEPGNARLLFIYNADGGWMNGALDFAHKLLSPSTYPCSLCALSHGNFGARVGWRQMLDALPLPATILHRDEWQRLAPGEVVALPAIVREAGGTRRVLVSAAELAMLGSLEALADVLTERLGRPA